MNSQPCDRTATRVVVACAALLGCSGVACSRTVRPKLPMEGGAVAKHAVYLVDDFAKEGGLSALGTKWSVITDQVMGGKSTALHTFETLDSRRCIRLLGNVSLKNNGGFVQSRLAFDPRGRLLDARQFTGIRLWVRGNGERYNVHLRTSRTWLPWQYFYATFDTTSAWTKVELPFTAFKDAGFTLGTRLNPGKLKTLAIVAIKKEFQADVAVARIELYR